MYISIRIYVFVFTYFCSNCGRHSRLGGAAFNGRLAAGVVLAGPESARTHQIGCECVVSLV